MAIITGNYNATFSGGIAAHISADREQKTSKIASTVISIAISITLNSGVGGGTDGDNYRQL
ncbi:hypothetical protein A3219_22675 [Salmonella enterica]|nr:hypothetical protein A3219_22675 [Salmonella enterica]